MKTLLMACAFLVMAALLFAGTTFVKHATHMRALTKMGGRIDQTVEIVRAPLPRAGTRDPRTLDDVIISEDFESVTPGTLPSGWTEVDVDQGSTTDPGCPGVSLWKVYEDPGLPARSGTRVVANHYNDNEVPNNDWLILPQESLDGLISFSFWAESQDPAYPESFEVKVSATGTQPANFTNLVASVDSVPATYTFYTYDLSSFAGQPIYIAIHYNSVNEFIFKVDDVLLEAGTPGVVRGIVSDSATALPLAGVSVSITSGAATTTDASGNYQLAAMSGRRTLSFSLAGYVTNTDTNVVVAAGDTTVLNVTLNPSHTRIVLSEDFDAVAVGTLPTGWWQDDGDHGSTVDSSCPGLSIWKVIQNSLIRAHSGLRVVSNHYNDNSLPNDDWLILPQQTLPAPIIFSFWAESVLDGYPESFEVKVSTNDIVPSDFTHLIGSESAVPSAWTQYTYDLSAYAGTPFYVAIHYNATDEFIFIVDDVTLEAGLSDAADVHPALASSFAFAGNYPNPFNSQTVFRFSVPRSGPVELTLYNVNGQRVARVLNTALNPGEHSVRFDASGLTSGVYFARLKASGFTATRKMLLLK